MTSRKRGVNSVWTIAAIFSRGRPAATIAAMSCDPDTRNRLAHISRAQAKTQVAKPVHPLFAVPTFRVSRPSPLASRYRTCPCCGNKTRGTARAHDDRCAKCQAALPNASPVSVPQ